MYAPSLTPWALLAFVACSTPVPLDPVQTFATDPDAVLEQLAQAPPSVERDAILFTLLDTYPEQADRLCPLMPAGPLRKRCVRVQRSPHLTTPVPSFEPVPLPRATYLRFDERALSRWAGTAASPGDCAADDPQLHLCLVQEAAVYARAGDIEAAAARCLSSEQARWRQDCFFTTAEQLTRETGRLADASALCLGSGRFARECHGHLLIQAHALALEDPTHALAQRQVEELRGALEAEAADMIEKLYWCTYSYRLGERAPERLAEASRVLPDAVRPYLHNALALPASGQPDPRAALLSYLDGEVPPAMDRNNGARDWAVHWWEDLPGEEDLPAVPLRPNGNDRRTTSADPAIDQELALLGALGALPSPPLEVFVQALQHSDPRVRWTAARTLSQLAVEHPALTAARQDEDPLVVLRATPRSERPLRDFRGDQGRTEGSGRR